MLVPTSTPYTLVELDRRITTLETRAAPFRCDPDACRQRLLRTAVSLPEFERREMNKVRLKKQAHAAELAIRPIDEQLQVLRELHRQTKLVEDRQGPKKKRGAPKSDDDDEVADACSICQESLATGVKQTTLCGHTLHRHCYRDLLRIGQDVRCPLCRACLQCGPGVHCDACNRCHQHGGHASGCAVGLRGGEQWLLTLKLMNGSIKTILVQPAVSTISCIKQAAFEDRIPHEMVRIFHAGRELLGDDTPLASYKIGDAKTLHVILRLRGGGDEPDEPDNIYSEARQTAAVGQHYAGTFFVSLEDVYEEG